MTGLVRARYTLEFKQEVVRLVRGGQTVSLLKVSASGYRQHRARQAGGTGPLQPGRRIGDVALLVHFKAIFNEMKGAYGWPRIWRELSTRGIHTGKERV